MHSYLQVVLILTVFHRLNGQKSDTTRLNYFDIDLLKYASEERRGNVVVSPASIKSTLAMVLEGANGDTAAEIRSALRLSPNKKDFREQLNLYLSALKGNASNTATLHNANAVFVSDELKLNKEYDMMLRAVYMTEICKTNFKDPLPAAGFINSWISNNTRGLIPVIVEPAQITPATEILLTNALYFKGTWKNTFNPRSTRGGCFYLQGICRSVAMMELHAELNYAYVDNLRAHAVELPYKGDDYSMILLVPQEREGVAALVRDLPYMSLPQISTLFEPTDVSLALPQFTIDYSTDMITVLKIMRISLLFSSKANISGIFEGDSSAQINNLLHKVHISVDEAGTVAAAATSAMVIPLIQNGVQIRVDRPFVFFIRDNKHGLVLFEGKIEEPSVYVEKNGIGGAPTKKNQPGSIKRSYG